METQPVVAPVVVAPPVVAQPAVPPRVDDAGKSQREAMLALQRREAAANQKIEQAEAALKKREADHAAREAAFERAKKIGAHDLIGLYKAAGVPDDKIGENLNAAQIKWMQDREIPESADAPVLKLQQEIELMKTERQREKEERIREAQEQEDRKAQERQDARYRELNRRIQSAPECDLTKIPILSMLLDQNLLKYEEETKLDSGPVFADMARAAEAEIDKELNGRSRYLIKDGKQFDSTGAVIGYVSATPPAAAAPVAPTVTPNPLDGPQPRKPAATVQQMKEPLPVLDSRDAVPVPAAVFGKRLRPTVTRDVERYEAISAAANAAP